MTPEEKHVDDWLKRVEEWLKERNAPPEFCRMRQRARKRTQIATRSRAAKELQRHKWLMEPERRLIYLAFIDRELEA